MRPLTSRLRRSTMGAGERPWGLRQVHLGPGQLLVSEEPWCITTVLGSCVAIALFAPRRRFAAMCHGVLPRGGAAAPAAEQMRFLDQAVAAMTTSARCSGIDVTELRAKLFGGARVLGGSLDEPVYAVGAQNIVAAEELLLEAGIPVVARDVGGEQGRHLHFNTATGEVLLRRLGAKEGVT